MAACAVSNDRAHRSSVAAAAAEMISATDDTTRMKHKLSMLVTNNQFRAAVWDCCDTGSVTVR